MLAVGLGSTVFLWNAQDSSVRPWPRPPRAGGRAALAPTGLARRGRQRPCGACCAPVCRACSRPGMRRRGIKLGARARARPPRAGVAQHSVCARGHAALMRSASALWGAGGCCACGSRRTPAATRRGGGRGSRSCAAAGSLPASPAAAAGRAGGVAGRAGGRAAGVLGGVDAARRLPGGRDQQGRRAHLRRGHGARPRAVPHPPLPGTGGVRHAGALLKLRMRGSSGAAPVPCQQTCPGPADWGAQRGGAGVQARASALAGAPGAPVLLWQGVHTRCSPRPPERLLSGAARGEYGPARRALPPSPLATGRGVAAPPGAAALLTGRRRAGRRRRWCASCARTVAAWARWPGAATRWRPAGRTGASC